MDSSYQLSPSISPIRLPTIRALSPALSPICPHHINAHLATRYLCPCSSFPLSPLSQPAISAIISSNERLMVDRKLKRKAETHKTIPCRAWKDTGRCNYGEHCKFAHGENDLRKTTEEPIKLFNNPRYRTVMCLKYYCLGSCPYGEHCSYIHGEDKKIDLEKCLEELEDSSESPQEREKPESCYNQDLVIMQVEKVVDEGVNECSTSQGRKSEGNFFDPFSSNGVRENIEFRLYPFLESFLRHPFSVL